jgi:hypothetical protein
VVQCVYQYGKLELYGTEEDLDVVARVGEGLDGKVANFRVYDKYLHEEQALELWDCPKGPVREGGVVGRRAQGSLRGGHDGTGGEVRGVGRGGRDGGVSTEGDDR